MHPSRRAAGIIGALVLAAAGYFFVRSNLLDRESPADPATRSMAPAEGVRGDLPSNAPLAESPAAVGAVDIGPGAGVVSGILIRADGGEPIADTRINVRVEDATEPIEATTDEGGYFFFREIPTGSYEASLDDPGLVLTRETMRFAVTSDDPDPELILIAIPPARISGRVYDADTGRGIAGVTVRAGGGAGGGVTSSITDESGAFTFGALTDDAYRISYETPEGYPDRRRIDNRKLVTAVLGGEVDGVDFALTRGLTIAGHVVDIEGRPIANAGVTGYAEGDGAYDDARTGSDGSFTLAGFGVHQQVRLTANARGHAFRAMESQDGLVRVGDEPVSGVRLVLGPEARVSGIVVDSEGNAVAGVRAGARAVDGGSFYGHSVESKEDGAISIGQLSAGEYYIDFERSEGQWDDSGRHLNRFTVTEGEHRSGLCFEMPERSPGKYSISGRVTRSNGEPFDAAEVAAIVNGTLQSARPGEDGFYSITGLEEGEYDVVMQTREGTLVGPVRANAGDTNVNFVVKLAMTIEGRVVDRRSGAPVREFAIRSATIDERTNRRSGFVNLLDEAGAFTLTNIVEGTNRIDVRAEGYADASLSIAPVNEGRTLSDVVIRMDEGAVLEGRVVDRESNGILGAKVYQVESSGRRRGDETSAVTAADGSFRLGSLTPGPVALVVEHPLNADKFVETNVRAGAVNRIEIVLLGGGVVEGVVRLNGRPQAGQEVWLQLNDDSIGPSRTGTDGVYHFDKLPDGEAKISAQVNVDGFHARSETDALVSDGSVTQVDFDFTTGQSVIEGTVFSAPSVPVGAGVNVYARIEGGPADSRSFTEETDSNGFYRIEGVPRGVILLNVFSSRLGQKQVQVEVGDRDRIRHDFDLFGGAALRVTLSGAIRPGNSDVRVSLVYGHANQHELTVDAVVPSVASSRILPVLRAVPISGRTAIIPNVDPGEYWVVITAHDPATLHVPVELNRTAQLSATRIEVAGTGEIEVRLAL